LALDGRRVAGHLGLGSADPGLEALEVSPPVLRHLQRDQPLLDLVLHEPALDGPLGALVPLALRRADHVGDIAVGLADQAMVAAIAHGDPPERVDHPDAAAGRAVELAGPGGLDLLPHRRRPERLPRALDELEALAP
jgi:hypothetical protein